MELYQDIFRVIGLVVVWAIPTILVVAVIVFAILAPVMTLSGVFLRLYQAIHNVFDKLPGGVRAKTKPSLDVGTLPERPLARDERPIELVGIKTQPSLDIGAAPERPTARDERPIELVGTKTQPSLDIGAAPERPTARDERPIELVRRT